MTQPGDGACGGGERRKKGKAEEEELEGKRGRKDKAARTGKQAIVNREKERKPHASGQPARRPTARITL